MNDAAANLKKSELNKALSAVDPNVAIAFGCELFEEFRKRNWFTLEMFGALGTNFLATKVPAYNRAHYVFKTWAIKDDEFKIG